MHATLSPKAETVAYVVEHFYEKVSPRMLRYCAQWHDRQSKRNPARANHHIATAARLRRHANVLVRMISGSVN
jgi:hypothetical protein